MNQKRRILIVDDHPINRRLPAKLLKAHGWECELACDGKAALSRLSETRFDAVLLDLSMPGLSGYEVCHLIRSNLALAQLRMIAFTAMSTKEEVVRGAGFDGLLCKPLSADKLLALLNDTPPGKDRA